MMNYVIYDIEYLSNYADYEEILSNNLFVLMYCILLHKNI